MSELVRSAQVCPGMSLVVRTLFHQPLHLFNVFFYIAGEMMSDGSVSALVNPCARRKKKFKPKNRYTEDAS